MSEHKPVVIISQSGRAIATSAAMAGFPPCVIDNFADTDTKSIALKSIEVSGNLAAAIERDYELIFSQIRSEKITGVIIGSGLEASPDTIERLEGDYNCLGNSAEIVKRIKDPQIFFPALEKMGIACPEFSLDKPEDCSSWLAKHIGGCGGIHISSVKNDSLDNCYYQRFTEGRNLSVLFLASKKSVILIGMNDILSRDPANGDFTYTGAISINTSEEGLLNKFTDIVNKVSSTFELIGLCGMDCIIDRSGQIKVLEINPRPTATFELHQLKQSLIGLHIDVCLGKKIEYVAEKLSFCRGSKIIYISNDFIVPKYTWPDWVVDRPYVGRKIVMGQPFCTISAFARTQEKVRALLEMREHHLLKQLGFKRQVA